MDVLFSVRKRNMCVAMWKQGLISEELEASLGKFFLNCIVQTTNIFSSKLKSKPKIYMVLPKLVWLK